MGWALWQKLSFVLACGLVFTILAGLAKLWYDRVKLRKYAKVEKGKQAQTPEMIEAQPISEEPKEDVPFGIRAIESGIEVDGVWISRSNTPVGSSRSSMTDVRLPRSNTGSQLELPKTLLSSSRNSSTSNFGSTFDRAISGSAFDRAVSAERIPTNDSRSPSPARDQPSSYRGLPPMAPTAHLSTLNSHRNSSALQALEGPDTGSSARLNGQISSSTSGNSRSSNESDYMALPEGRPFDAVYINPPHASLSVPVDPRTDLDLLQSHRLSHVAETGQLTPRVRRPGQSGEWASVADNVRLPNEVTTANGVDYFVPQQKTPSPPPRALATTQEHVSGPSGSNYYPTNPGKQPMPQLDTYTTQPLPQTYQPRGPQFEEEPSHYEVQTAQNSQHQSQVLRKVNSGFEILRPGTFGEPSSPEEDKPAEGEKRKSKRLQKRRTSSSASRDRPSHFVEQV